MIVEQYYITVIIIIIIIIIINLIIQYITERIQQYNNNIKLNNHDKDKYIAQIIDVNILGRNDNDAKYTRIL